MAAREWGLVGRGGSLRGVCGDVSDGYTGMGRNGMSKGGMMGPPRRVWRAGKKLICSGVIWQAVRKAGARTWWMRSMLTNCSLPEALEMRTNSTGHLAASRGAVSPSVCLWAGMNHMCPTGI